MQKNANWSGKGLAVPYTRHVLRRPVNQILLVMKLTILLLTTLFFQVKASVVAQSVTLSGKQLTLEQVFTAIEKQTDYVVFSKQEFFQDTHPVSLAVQHMPLDNFLALVLKDQPLNFRMVGKNIILSHKTADAAGGAPLLQVLEGKPVSGHVQDSLGRPLERVSVRLSPGGHGTYSDAAGNFELRDVPPGNHTLEASFVGCQTFREKIVVDGQQATSLGTITMRASALALEGVSVTYSTGYENIPKERATGAFATVSNDMLRKRPVSNISSALQGLVAGMQATEHEDGSMEFLIRGASSLYADKSPLVVVDGFPVSASDFSDINPNDVESVTVLKDAAAASIWGARSANGVIVIVTKKGRFASKLKVEANVFTRISRMVNLDQVLTQANSADQVAYERRAFDNNWVFPYSYAGSFTDITNPLTLAQEMIYANKDGDMSTAQMNAGLDSLSKINNRGQIRDLLMQHAVLDQYNVTLQSGSDRTKSYTSILYEKNKGSFIKNSYQRFNLNMNNEFKLARFLRFSIGANISYKTQETSGATLDEIQQLSPYETLLNPDGSYSVNLNKYNRKQLSLIPYDQFTYADWSYNLLQEVRGRKFTNDNLSARIQTGLNIQLMDGLNFDSKFQYERSRAHYEDYYSESTFYVRDMVNFLTPYDPDTQTVGESALPKGGILKPHTTPLGDIGDQNVESYLIRNQLSFNKIFNGKHSVSAIAGTELSQYTHTGVAPAYTYGYSPDNLFASEPPFGYGNSYIYLNDMTGYSESVPGATPYFTWERDKYVSFYGNASYTYNGKYTVSGSARSDASNFITSNPRLRWSPLWSVGAKWNMKQEAFLKDATSLDRLELRFTYGKNGNAENSTSTKALIGLSSGISPTTGTITASVYDNGNPSLRWEETTTHNLGIDFGLLGNKLFGSVDLYNKRGEGIIGNIALPAATGTTVQMFNNAGIINRGVELTLGANVDMKSIGLRYTTTVTYAYNYNRINDLYNPSLYVYELLGGAFVEGRPVNSVYAFKYLGMQDGEPMVAGVKGAPNPINSTNLEVSGNGKDVLQYMGTGTPPHTLGWVNTIDFHNFTLTAIFTGKFGGVYRNPAFDYSSMAGFQKISVNKFVRNVLAGDPSVPGFAKPNESSLYAWDYYTPYLNTLVESSSYVECKELTLQYLLPSRLLKPLGLGSVQAFVQTRDLGLVWSANKNHYNPDWLPGTNRPVQSYTLGLNVQL